MIKDYNIIDFENDSTDVIIAKMVAIAKELHKMSETEENNQLAELLKKPLGEWP